MPDRDQGRIASLERSREALTNRIVENVERMRSEYIDQQAVAQPVSRRERVERWLGADEAAWEELLDREGAAEGLNAFDPQRPEDYQVPRTVLSYHKERGKEWRALQEKEK